MSFFLSASTKSYPLFFILILLFILVDEYVDLNILTHKTCDV